MLIEDLVEYTKGEFNRMQLGRVITALHGYTFGRKKDSVIRHDLLLRAGKIVLPTCANTPELAQAGADILFPLEVVGIIRLTEAGFELMNKELLLELWHTLDARVSSTRPSLNRVADWNCNRHVDGYRLVSGEGAQFITAAANPMIFSRVNSAQSIAWAINETVLEVATTEFETRGAGFDDIWSLGGSQAADTKVLETRAILRLGHELKHYASLYHLYHLDFRGRIYPRTAYLHEQGCDLARGLLMRAEKKPIGEEGLAWLMICLANTWAGKLDDGHSTDKLPIEERIAWAAQNEADLISYANQPYLHKGWAHADKPWRFLAYCNELKRVRNWEAAGHSPYSYETGVEGCIDGTTNGLQHIAAILRDPILARQVNLCAAERPEDLYMFVARNVWATIDGRYAQLAPAAISKYERINNEIVEIAGLISSGVDFTINRTLADRLKSIRSELKDELEDLCVVFWHKIRSEKERRKIVKRNVMTLPYGVSRYGMISQQMKDAHKHGIDGIQHLCRIHATYMGCAVHCKSGLSNAMELLEVLRNAGANMEFLSWTAPITGFPIKQKYKKFRAKPVNIVYGGEKITIKLPFKELATPDSASQAAGVAPNVIHSLDATHLMLTAFLCKSRGVIPTTIHDCYAAHLCDMPLVFKMTREAFVRLYRVNPIFDIFKSLKISYDMPQGEFDINEVFNSDFCFS